jgi:hypothetical protein
MRNLVRTAVKWLPALLLLPMLASAADEGRFSFLEQEVRNLQRQVQVLTRQLDELRSRPDRLASTAAPGADPETSGTGLPQWVDAQRWQRVRRGMSELEVISSLGRPNSVREEGDARVLFYAMEIGSSRFLAGSVKLRQRAVVEVLVPTLQ